MYVVKKKLASSSLLFILISLILVLISLFWEIPVVPGIIQTVFARPLAYLYSARIVPESPDLAKLQEENRKLREQLVSANQLKMDNQALRNQFNESSIPNERLLPARVIGFEGKYNFPHTLIIDKGNTHGVRVGQAVVVQKYLVGEVSRVSEAFSLVRLPSHPNFSTVGKTSQYNATGVLAGAEDFIVLDRVVITDTLGVGDTVVTKGDVAGNGIGILPDIIVGKIVSIDKQESDPFQSAKIESLINYAALSTVFVVY